MMSEGDAHKQQTFTFNADSELKQPVQLDDAEQPSQDAPQPNYAAQQSEGLDESWQETVDDERIEAELQKEMAAPLINYPKKRSIWGMWARILFLLALILVIAESVHAFNQYWQNSPLLAGIFASFIALLLLGTFTFLFSEWRKLNALKQMDERRAVSAQILNGQSAEAIDSYCNSLLPSRIQSQLAESIEQWQQAQQPHHDDAERLALYEAIVMRERDQAALAVVARWSAEAGVLVGASPLAALDLLFIVWRNTRMLDAIATCYGLELGLVSRIKLLHMVLFNLAFVGATEVSLDIGFQTLGADVVTKLSGRIAQGMGAGLLSARLGLKAMQLCRPIHFNPDSHAPSLKDVSKELKRQMVEKFKG